MIDTKLLLSRHDFRRKIKSHLVLLSLALLSLVAIVPFMSILWYVGSRGFSALNWDFFTQLPKSVGESGGGIANAWTWFAPAMGQTVRSRAMRAPARAVRILRARLGDRAGILGAAVLVWQQTRVGGGGKRGDG
jgi:predicted NBD/HSP70 family sugar kinase